MAEIFIDRRKNTSGKKSLGNRQRFVRRAKEIIRKAVKKSVSQRGIQDQRGETVSIPTKGLGEPQYRHDPTTGRQRNILSGNDRFSRNDRISKPEGEGGGQGGGKGGDNASDGGEGEDNFDFVVPRNEYLDILFEGLELPDMIKKHLKQTTVFTMHRSGFTTAGNPSNLDLLRTMRQSLGRRIAFKRPDLVEIDEAEERLEELESKREEEGVTDEEVHEIEELSSRIIEMKRKQMKVPYIDPIDVRFRNFEKHPEPMTNAVMFCLMDVSGSMREWDKELAKRFFILLNLFLERQYDNVDVVFIRHTHIARECDEDTFFHSKETGGTVVSTALEKMKEIIRDRYPSDQWNIYAAQASDGDNWGSDNKLCVEILNDILKLCQYYAYIEILDPRLRGSFKNSDDGTDLWKTYRIVYKRAPHFEMKRVSDPKDIYPVFRELFEKDLMVAQRGKK